MSWRYKDLKRGLSHPLEYVLVKGLALLVRSMPPTWSVALGGWAGAAAFSLLRIRRGICMTNLAVAFPERDEKERARIARESYANLGRSLAEILVLGKAGPGYFRDHVRWVNRENFERLVSEGRGALAVTGHFGSWEIMAAAARNEGMPLALLIGRQKNKQVDRLFNNLRERQGLELIPLDQALRGVLRALKNNRIIALLGDQDARRLAGVEVEFFGRPTSVHEGAALFSLKTGAKIVCPFIVRQGRGIDHTITIEPPLEYTATGDRVDDIRGLTQMHARMLERWIRKHPDHWFWGHKRWKSVGLYR